MKVGCNERLKVIFEIYTLRIHWVARGGQLKIETKHKLGRQVFQLGGFLRLFFLRKMRLCGVTLVWMMLACCVDTSVCETPSQPALSCRFTPSHSVYQ